MDLKLVRTSDSLEGDDGEFDLLEGGLECDGAVTLVHCDGSAADASRSDLAGGRIDPVGVRAVVDVSDPHCTCASFGIRDLYHVSLPEGSEGLFDGGGVQERDAGDGDGHDLLRE